MMRLMKPYSSAQTQGSSKVKKVPLLLFVIAVLLAGSAAAVRGQSALDGFDPNANSVIFAVAVQPDGKVLIGGQFTTLSPNGGAAVASHFIARLNPDGTLDSSFYPNPNSYVRAIAVQADGKIVIGEDFTALAPNNGASVTRKYIARLNPDGTLDTSYNPVANATVNTLVLQPDGRILAGGTFNTFFPNNGSSVTRRAIARINTDGTIDSGFNPNASTPASPAVYTIVVQADGSVLAGGHFTTIGGQTRTNIARLDATTGAADSFNPSANSDVNTIVVQADGKIVVGGLFNAFISTPTIGGQTRNRIARLDPVTGLADSFDPNANSTVNALALQSDGKILGRFRRGKQHRRTDALLFGPAQPHERPGRYMGPKRGRWHQYQQARGAVGWKDSRRRRVLNDGAQRRGDGDAQLHCTASRHAFELSDREHEYRALVGDKLHRLHPACQHQSQPLEHRHAPTRSQWNVQRRDQLRERPAAFLSVASITNGAVRAGSRGTPPICFTPSPDYLPTPSIYPTVVQLHSLRLRHLQGL